MHRLFYLQNAFFAIQNNIDAISRAFTNNIIPEWIEKSMLKLKKIESEEAKKNVTPADSTEND